MKERMSKQGRAQEVKLLLENLGGGVSEKVLAESQGLVKSPSFRLLLEEMCERDELLCLWEKAPNGHLARYFYLPWQQPRLEGF